MVEQLRPWHWNCLPAGLTSWGRGSYRVSFINFAAREINCKIVYYGAGLGGKTTNLQWIFEQTLGKTGGKMISLATETDRTLFFDFLPLDLGSIRGFKTRFHLYTVPGQVFYDASRKLILRGVDGVIFVADSQEERMDANIEALENLDENLREHNYDFKKMPYILQLNKRDLPNALPVDDLKKALLKKDEAVFEAVAYKGVGVFETLKECGRQVLAELKKG
jgi:signal recognition particle receptor subunit beta